VNIKGLALCALVTLSTPAAAQWGPYGPAGYGPVGFHEIRASLRANGLRPISQPVLTGRYVVIRAVDRYGEPVRVLLSARFGDVVSVTPLAGAQVAGAYEPRPFRPYAVYPERRYEALEPPRRYGAVRPDLMSEPEGPPASAHSTIPNGRDGAPNGRAAAPTAAPRSAAVTPNRTPTPRPRPAAAGATAAVTPAPAAVETKPAPAAPAATETRQAPPPAATEPKQAATAAEQSKPAPATRAVAPAAPEAPAITGSTTPLPPGRHTFPPTMPLE
jgi:hypothetical protein